MDITLAKTFINIVRANGLSPAAQNLGVSQSTISHRLQLLENELGFPLLERNRGQAGIQLSPQGEHFLDYAIRWVDLEREIQMLKQNIYTEQLCIGGVESINTYLFPQVFSGFLKENPNYSLRILTHHSWELYDLLYTKDIDIGFVNTNSFHPDISSELLLNEDYMILHNMDRLKDKVQISPLDLEPKLEIVHSWTPQLEQWHNEWWTPGQERIYLNSNSLLSSFFPLGDFWCILPASNARVFQKDFGLYVASLCSAPPPRACCVITNKQNSSLLQKKIDYFLLYVKDVLSKLSN
ncbi:LysR family transcriptional regulator [Hespellia stercorisuis]|uniref:DNA-binding transcriptional regulator, LysR family n=1 Tax=Hespellia stercorisuis DSM 15480 TaxID=1121950 RepID=A0A1M6KBB0_9FIRM|nr:LysR family transcriptional regulator [Hespellia stercorisuis]SHJ56192.1 DNA-binding transcriptional regulator, LysR family [Hespellia stercorisuis DSM 15480]